MSNLIMKSCQSNAISQLPSNLILMKIVAFSNTLLRLLRLEKGKQMLDF